MFVAFVEVVALYFLSSLYILQEMIGHQWKATSLLTVGVQSASNLPVSYLLLVMTLLCISIAVVAPLHTRTT